LISTQVSELTAHLGASSHATTREEVAQIRRIRPVVPVEGLPERLAYEVVQNEALVNLLHRHCGTERTKHALFAYEDTVDGAPDAVEHWSEIMVQLGLWAAPDLERVRNRGATGTHAVHAVMPLSEVVANYDEVADTLRGGVFEWMLGEDRRRLSSDCALPDALAHPFLVFTRTRSGSRWFVDTVRRLGDGVANAKELSFDGTGRQHFVRAAGPNADACASATPSRACVCALRQVFARAHQERRNRYRKALGFKFMTHLDTSNQKRHHQHGTHPFASMTAMASAACDIPFVLLLRKNVLRREISNEAAKMRGSASHAATAAAAADLRRFRPSIRIHGLVARLANEHDQNERLASLFRRQCGDARLHWYEDVVDRPDWATIMYQLGL
jgi:LPS sulfotransferase NodH